MLPPMYTESTDIETMDNNRPNPIVQCLFCKTAIKEVEKMIGNDRDEATIRIALGKVCSHMPRVAKRRCTKYVRKYSNEIVELLAKRLPPKEVMESC